LIRRRHLASTHACTKYSTGKIGSLQQLTKLNSLKLSTSIAGKSRPIAFTILAQECLLSTIFANAFATVAVSLETFRPTSSFGGVVQHSCDVSLGKIVIVGTKLSFIILRDELICHTLRGGKVSKIVLGRYGGEALQDFLIALFGSEIAISRRGHGGRIGIRGGRGLGWWGRDRSRPRTSRGRLHHCRGARSWSWAGRRLRTSRGRLGSWRRPPSLGFAARSRLARRAAAHTSQIAEEIFCLGNVFKVTECLVNERRFVKVRRGIDAIIGFVVEEPKTAETTTDGSLLSRSRCDARQTAEKDETSCCHSGRCRTHVLRTLFFFGMDRSQ